MFLETKICKASYVVTSYAYLDSNRSAGIVEVLCLPCIQELLISSICVFLQNLTEGSQVVNCAAKMPRYLS